MVYIYAMYSIERVARVIQIKNTSAAATLCQWQQSKGKYTKLNPKHLKV